MQAKMMPIFSLADVAWHLVQQKTLKVSFFWKSSTSVLFSKGEGEVEAEKEKHEHFASIFHLYLHC